MFVVGDAAAFAQDGRPLPGVAQVAIQQVDMWGGWFARASKPRRAAPISLLRQGQYGDRGAQFCPA